MLLFWLPLAASWLLMSAEAPILQAAISRLSDMQTQLAAFGIVMSLQITIESPVIMLLATSTALSTSAANYLTLQRFMIWVNLLSTLVAVLMAYGPLYPMVVQDWMGIPADIAAAGLPGMRIMILWTAAIGVRRFLQGVLIRQGETRWIGYGTVVRLTSSAGGGILLAVFTNLPGVHIGSFGVMAGVISEAIFVICVARPAVRRLLTDESYATGEALTLWEVARYHLPLAATSLLTLLAQPVIGAGLARMPDPRENLAAWPVVWNLLFMFRSPAFALPEAVIALLSRRQPRDAVRLFCRRAGYASAAALALLAFTPLSGFYLRYLAGLPDDLARFVVPGLLLAVPIPFINAIHSWIRGLLMTARMTKAIYWGMGLNLVLTGAVMLVAVLLQGPGSASAVVALTIAFLAEIYYLRRAAARVPGSAPA